MRIKKRRKINKFHDESNKQNSISNSISRQISPLSRDFIYDDPMTDYVLSRSQHGRKVASQLYLSRERNRRRAISDTRVHRKHTADLFSEFRDIDTPAISIRIKKRRKEKKKEEERKKKKINLFSEFRDIDIDSSSRIKKRRKEKKKEEGKRKEEERSKRRKRKNKKRESKC